MARKGDKMKAEELFEKLGYKKLAGFESICYVFRKNDVTKQKK